jgi:SAM-dependent methyltransferase
MQCATQTSAERPCPVCGRKSQERFANERIDTCKISDFTYASRKQPEFMCLRLVRCNDCDLVYAPTPPATDFLLTAYSEAAYDSGPEAQAAAHSYAKALAPYLVHLAGKSAAVDVGAGSGPLLPWLIERGFSPVIGIEPSRAAIDAAPSAVRPMLREGMFSSAMLANVRPSLLCSFMTLEHLEDPNGFFRTAYELLEPGGMIAVIVHNWRAPLNRLLGLHSPIIDVEHLQLFSPQSVRTLLVRNGFVSIDLQSISNAYPLRYWLRLAPLPVVIKSQLAGILDRFGLSDTQVSLRVGNMLAVGIKPFEEKR